MLVVVHLTCATEIILPVHLSDESNHGGMKETLIKMCMADLIQNYNSAMNNATEKEKHK